MTADDSDPKTDLRLRPGLPAELRATLLRPERAQWEGHALGGMADFWLGVHASLRHESAALRDVLRGLLEREADDATGLPALARARGIGLQLLGHTEMHHSIEDEHYFPQFIRAFPQLERAVGLLDSDHHVIEASLAAMAAGVERLGQPGPAHDTIGRLLDVTSGFEAILKRHLHDEEDIVVPVLLRMR